MNKIKKIAVFGGVYNPVHNGHIECAKLVKKHLAPDLMLFIPAGNPPHKRRMMVSGEHRLNMLRLSVLQEFDCAAVSDYEINCEEYSYTVNTLRYLKSVYGKEAELYFVIGSDNLENINSWYKPNEIRALATLAVVLRPGYSVQKAKELFPECEVCEGESIADSSSEIRELARCGKDFSHLVPKAVHEYIEKNKLYPKEVTDEAEIEGYVACKLKASRMAHTLGVCDTAVKLSGIYGVSEEKARKASLLHDVAKNLSLQEMLNLSKKYDIILDELQMKQKSLLHGIVSEGIAFFELGITDEEILDAIRFHTTGRAGMSTLSKIVFLADGIEPLRSYEGVEELRDLSTKDLDKACLAMLDRTICHLVDCRAEIHPDTLKARNYLIRGENNE